jgi:hypothetical protein
VPTTLKGLQHKCAAEDHPLLASFSCSLLSRADWPGALARPSHANNLADINLNVFCEKKGSPSASYLRRSIVDSILLFLPHRIPTASFPSDFSGQQGGIVRSIRLLRRRHRTKFQRDIPHYCTCLHRSASTCICGGLQRPISSAFNALVAVNKAQVRQFRSTAFRDAGILFLGNPRTLNLLSSTIIYRTSTA